MGNGSSLFNTSDTGIKWLYLIFDQYEVTDVIFKESLKN